MDKIMKYSPSANALTVLLFFFCIGCTGSDRVALPGNEVKADFTCRLADGSLVETTLAHVAGNDTVVKSPIFALRESYQPLAFKVPETVGTLQAKPFDPLEQKISVAIANRANQLPLMRSTLLELPNSQVDNFPPADRYLEMAMRFTLPRTREMTIQEFSKLYGSVAPVKDAVVHGDSNFPGVIRAVDDKTVTIHFSVREGAKKKVALGVAAFRALDEDHFEARMEVHEGQLIERIGGLPGRVTSIDDKKYVIDFGQSFAGETLYCEVTARPFDPEQAAKPVPIDWIEDFDQGLALARQQGKPVVLFLYSDGCPYCHQMENKVFPDPSLEQFRSSFVWLKINSEKQTEYGERFKQQGYPLTLVLNGVGGEQERFSGLQHVTTLAYKLDHILSPKKKG
jgi:hypothetical protein